MNATPRWGGSYAKMLAFARSAPANLNPRFRLGSTRAKEGKRQDALRMLDLAADLDPSNTAVQQWRAATIRGNVSDVPPPIGSGAVSGLEERAAAAPDNFEAHRALDYALAREGKYDRVVAMWNEFIARHPEEGRAYLERGGAYYHLGKLEEAGADAAKACDRGVSEGCARAKQVPNRR